MCACLLTWEHKLYYYFDMTIIAPFCTFQHESLRQWILEQYESIFYLVAYALVSTAGF